MAQTVKTIKLDVSAEQSFVYLKCKQYDSNSRIYQIILTDQNKPMTTLTGNELITATMLRSDGKSVDTVCQWDNGKVYLTMTDGMLSVAGDGTLEIRVYNSNSTEIISTMIAHVNVQNSTLPYDRMIKSDEFNVLNNLILSVMNIQETADEVNRLIVKIKTDIATYEADYGALSQEATDLINDLNVFLADVQTQENQRNTNENQRIANENARNQAEQKREADSAAAITNVNNAISNLTNTTNQSIVDANNKIDQAIRNMNTEIDNAITDMNTEVDSAIADMNAAKNDTISAMNNTIIATNDAISATANANNAADSLNQLNQAMTDEEAIRIANENQRIANEVIRQNQEAERERKTAEVIDDANNAIANTNSVIKNTIDATNRVNAISDDLEDKLRTDYFKGEKGNDGIITTLAGQFGLQVEGDYLVLYYTNGDTPPDMSVDSDGYLILNIPET